MNTCMKVPPRDRRKDPPTERRVGLAGRADSVRLLRPDPARDVDLPGSEVAAYRYRLGSHSLVLASFGTSWRRRAAVRRAPAEFALAVEGPWIVFGYRFGEGTPWSWAVPYNWHFGPSRRVVPAAVAPTPETYSRLWATLWISHVDVAEGRDRVLRAVALRPEFAHVLHGVLRDQSLRPFRAADAARALGRLRRMTRGSGLRVYARTRCAAASGYATGDVQGACGLG